MAKICYICLNIDENLIDSTECDSSNITIIDKLKSCVPEIEWKEELKICCKCSGLLENAYTFRELCINSNDAKLKVLTEKEEPKIEVLSEKETETTEINRLNEGNHDTYTCFHCGKIFTNKIFLERHIRMKHERKKFNCKNCNRKYISEKFWRKHENNCINKLREKIESSSEFKVHQEESKDVKIELKDCNISQCDICQASFNNKYLLKRHKKNVHATEKKFKCDICPSSFASPVYLSAHKRYHSGDRKHVCLFCGKGYITASDLYHHEKIHANKRAYRCNECSKAFNTSSDLHKHKLCVHIDKNLWKYACSFCDRKFPLKTNLDTHIKTHTGEKNFSCHLCEKKYISKSALSRHIDCHTNVKSFKCTICDFGYKYKKSLDIHMVTSHGIGNVKITQREKKYFCHICPKSYYVNGKLQKHLRSHTGDRPFKCPNCEKCFIDKSYIKPHLKVAHNIEFEN